MLTKAAGVTLNQDECEFSRCQVSFQLVDRAGVHPDPAKVKVIQKVPLPNNVGDIR